jgi:hypothetical protein
VHAGGQNITWSNPDPAKLPLFVLQGCIVPMLLSDVRSLCDANYVNNSGVATLDDGLLLQVYPHATCGFTVFDGTQAHCKGDGGGGTITVTSAPRVMQVQILATEPASVTLNGAVLPKQAPAAGGLPSWQFDAATGFVEVTFDNGGGTATITY